MNPGPPPPPPPPPPSDADIVAATSRDRDGGTIAGIVVGLILLVVVVLLLVKLKRGNRDIPADAGGAETFPMTIVNQMSRPQPVLPGGTHGNQGGGGSGRLAAYTPNEGFNGRVPDAENGSTGDVIYTNDVDETSTDGLSAAQPSPTYAIPLAKSARPQIRAGRSDSSTTSSQSPAGLPSHANYEGYEVNAPAGLPSHANYDGYEVSVAEYTGDEDRTRAAESSSSIVYAVPIEDEDVVNSGNIVYATPTYAIPADPGGGPESTDAPPQLTMPSSASASSVYYDADPVPEQRLARRNSFC